MSAAVLAGEAKNITTIWPAILPLIPLGGGLLVFLASRLSKHIYPYLALFFSTITLLATAGLYPLVQQGTLEYRLEQFQIVELSFRVDLVGFLFALLVAVTWFIITLFSLSYMRREKHSITFFVFLLFTLGGNLGVMLTGDFVLFFLFFELMTVASYVLIIHNRTKEAFQAGLYTLLLGIAGGLVLLGGMFLLYSQVGHVEIRPTMSDLQGVPFWLLGLMLACFMIGFGIKAGMIPLHVWMPWAYGASPALVNALSSGAMVKAGIYGMIRVVLIIFTPADMAAEQAFAFAAAAGYWIIWLGLLTMVLGALMALFQNHAMKLLAYSSISQMGYIIIAIGAAAYLFGLEEAMGFSGAVYHAFNHTLYKISFFLIFGIIFFHTREYRLDHLGGLGRKFPVLFVFFLLSFAAISGVPFLNGYISKTLIHDALLEAHLHYPSLDIFLAERLFVLGSALTFCYYAKLLYSTFFGRLPEELDKTYRTPVSMYLPLFILGGGIVALGVWPNYYIETYLLPAAGQFQFSTGGIEHLIGFNFFYEAPLNAALVVFLLAALISLIGFRFRFFWWQPPANLSIEKIVMRPMVCFLYSMLIRTGPSLDKGVNNFYYKMASSLLDLCRVIGRVDTSLDSFYEKSSQKAQWVVDKSRDLDISIKEASAGPGKTSQGVSGEAAESSEHSARDLVAAAGGERTDQAKEGGPQKTTLNPLDWSMKNLNFDSLLLVVMLGLVLFVLFFFGRTV